MTECEYCEYLKQKYTLLEQQYLETKKRAEQLEDHLLEMTEKTAQEEAELKVEILELCKKLASAEEKVSNLEKKCSRFQKDCEALLHLVKCNSHGNSASSLSSPQPQLTEAPDDPFINAASIQSSILNGTWAKNYEDLEFLKKEEGFIYGFRWDKGSQIQIV